MTPSSRAMPRRGRDIGLDVRTPREACDDQHCPFHGHLSVRGQVIEATVVSTAMQRTAVVERTLLHFVPKYERFEKRRRRYLAHNPPCLNIRTGRRVRIAETRPLAKNVSFCIVEDLGEVALPVPGDDVTAPHEPEPSATEPE